MALSLKVVPWRWSDTFIRIPYIGLNGKRCNKRQSAPFWNVGAETIRLCITVNYKHHKINRMNDNFFFCSHSFCLLAFSCQRIKICDKSNKPEQKYLLLFSSFFRIKLNVQKRNEHFFSAHLWYNMQTHKTTWRIALRKTLWMDRQFLGPIFGCMQFLCGKQR